MFSKIMTLTVIINKYLHPYLLFKIKQKPLDDKIVRLWQKFKS